MAGVGYSLDVSASSSASAGPSASGPAGGGGFNIGGINFGSIAQSPVRGGDAAADPSGFASFDTGNPTKIIWLALVGVAALGAVIWATKRLR